MASSTSMFQSISVRMARSWAGALRAVTSAVRMRMCAVGRLLQVVQRHQQRLERAVGQGLCDLVHLVLLKRMESLVLVDLLGLVAKQHGIAVKGDAHLCRVCGAGVRRVRVHLGGGHASLQRGCAHRAGACSKTNWRAAA